MVATGKGQLQFSVKFTQESGARHNIHTFILQLHIHCGSWPNETIL
jgi:hypothetical protein